MFYESLDNVLFVPGMIVTAVACLTLTEVELEKKGVVHSFVTVLGGARSAPLALVPVLLVKVHLEVHLAFRSKVCCRNTLQRF